MKGMTNASPGVGQFAAGKLGTIKGGTADGSVQAQEDGTGTVVGWSGKASTADVTALTSATGKAFGSMAISEGADKVTVAMTGIDGSTSISEDIGAATTEKAGVLTATWFSRLQELWGTPSDYYTLTITLIGDGAEGVPNITIDNRTIPVPSDYKITIENLRTNQGYFISLNNPHGYGIGSEIESSSPAALVTSKMGDLLQYIINTSSTNATLTINVYY